MGDVDISNEGIFCHKDGSESCGTGKPENLTILFKQKNQSEINKLVCNSDDNYGGVALKNNIYTNIGFPIDNNLLPGHSFLIDNTLEDSTRNLVLLFMDQSNFFSAKHQTLLDSG